MITKLRRIMVSAWLFVVCRAASVGVLCQRALKTGHDWADQNRPPEVSIALGAGRTAQGRDESTHCEPATFNRHAGGQWVVRPQDCTRTGRASGNGWAVFAPTGAWFKTGHSAHRLVRGPSSKTSHCAHRLRRAIGFKTGHCAHRLACRPSQSMCSMVRVHRTGRRRGFVGPADLSGLGVRAWIYRRLWRR